MLTNLDSGCRPGTDTIHCTEAASEEQVNLIVSPGQGDKVIDSTGKNKVDTKVVQVSGLHKIDAPKSTCLASSYIVLIPYDYLPAIHTRVGERGSGDVLLASFS